MIGLLFREQQVAYLKRSQYNCSEKLSVSNRLLELIFQQSHSVMQITVGLQNQQNLHPSPRPVVENRFQGYMITFATSKKRPQRECGVQPTDLRKKTSHIWGLHIHWHRVESTHTNGNRCQETVIPRWSASVFIYYSPALSVSSSLPIQRQWKNESDAMVVKVERMYVV